MQMPKEQRLSSKKVRDLITGDKRRLVEVPYTASLADTINALVANHVVAVPVAAPPGHWIGAGGSMILESDKLTGVIRKHYIGMVTMVDVLAHLAGEDDQQATDGPDLDRRMSVPVSSIIGHCAESLSLWTLNSNTSILDCMELFSKGIHRALVPQDSQMENVSGVELVESASSYRMITQMDLLKFVVNESHECQQLQHIMSRSVSQLGAVNLNVVAVTHLAKVMDSVRCMKSTSLTAVPIVEASSSPAEHHNQLVNGEGRKIIGTFSATDLRRSPISQMQSWMRMSVLEFTDNISSGSGSGSGSDNSNGREKQRRREIVACRVETSVGEVVNMAVNKHVHRVWVVDRAGFLTGLVSLTDMIRVVRESLLLTDSSFSL